MKINVFDGIRARRQGDSSGALRVLTAHHIVEKRPSNITQFGEQAINNTDNLIKLPHGKGTIHAKVSGYYSSIQPFSEPETVRQWLNPQSFQAQYDFGIETLKNLGWKP